MADPTFEQLQARLTRLAASAVVFGAAVYRSSTPEYATEDDLLTGEGSRLRGGRWNPKGITVVYTSLTPETAMAETLAHYRYSHVAIEDAMPRTFVAIEVALSSVLDFRDGKLRQQLRVSEKQMLEVDWRREVYAGREPITQRLGRAAHTVGLEGLVVPSAADPGGHNLLIFPDHVGGGSVVRLLNPNKLGKPRSAKLHA